MAQNCSGSNNMTKPLNQQTNTHSAHLDTQNLIFGAVLALVVCALAANGVERNIQEVLEDRYKELARGAPEAGSLPLIVSKEINTVIGEPEEQEAPQIAPVATDSTTECKCQQAQTSRQAEPETAAPAESPKKKSMKKEEIKVAPTEEVAEEKTNVEEPEKSCVQSSAPVAAEKLQVEEERALETEEKLVEEELVGKKVREEKSGKKEKNKQKSKKRDKRDTKGGKNKSKSKSKRSSDGKSKENRKSGKDKKRK